MHSETHELVTRLALSAVEEDAVVRVPTWFRDRVMGANVDLDRSSEYESELTVTEMGDLKIVRRRVAHHTCGERRILRKLDAARRDVLRGRLTREGAQRLGEALHYIQDRCVPSPKFDRRLHDLVEREAARAHGALHAAALYSAPRPVGRGELKRLLRQQGRKRGESGAEALRCAAIYTFAALYAVLANPRKAPEDLVERAERARQAFSRSCSLALRRGGASQLKPLPSSYRAGPTLSAEQLEFRGEYSLPSGVPRSKLALRSAWAGWAPLEELAGLREELGAGS